MRNRKRIKRLKKTCCICDQHAEYIHHAYGGDNLYKSIIYGLGCYLCPECYDNARRLKSVNEVLKAEARYNFAFFHPNLDFYKIFKEKRYS